ncbi:TIGR01777 family oxidoreductase [Cellulophaga omnivescoria]|uniref:TIGR01777 family oxidoreductase n=1 Tax=Cellulophaga omnivescoria TaxID=1888890 RepID=UPI0022F13577|nr:TIGR01777 family oxidoreductase [Cellulophaga omnivescoria]WBU88275.1 TIGR01777 family oxidoreductase [Cellulophaga omnivescoria]
MNKLVIAGGTGFLGNELLDFYTSKFTEIIVLTRSKPYQAKNINYVQWDAKTIGTWHSCLNNADVLINLTGKSVDCRFTKKNKALILNSRIDSTLALGKAINLVDNPPKVWLNASSAAISHPNKEENGEDFMLDVGIAWEKAFESIKNVNTRKIALRISLVFGKNGGALVPLKKISQLGLGGKQGSGKQMVSWVHIKDFVAITNFAIENTKITGPIVVAAPDAKSNKKLMATIRKALKVPFGLPAYSWMLKIGGFIIGTEPSLILNSMDVYPDKLIKNGFKFKYATLEMALKNLLK